MDTNKKQILVLILGCVLSNGITLAGPYCIKISSQIPSHNRMKFLEICKYIDKYNEILQEADIEARYNISESHFMSLIAQGNRDKIREYLNNYTKNFDDLFSRDCTERVCYCGAQECKNIIIETFKKLENVVNNYFK
jgi:hypothetical protein